MGWVTGKGWVGEEGGGGKDTSHLTQAHNCQLEIQSSSPMTHSAFNLLAAVGFVGTWGGLPVEDLN
jgi:hypothetical protein